MQEHGANATTGERLTAQDDPSFDTTEGLAVARRRQLRRWLFVPRSSEIVASAGCWRRWGRADAGTSTDR